MKDDPFRRILSPYLPTW